jgi:hypothetical protein
MLLLRFTDNQEKRQKIWQTAVQMSGLRETVYGWIPPDCLGTVA